MGELVTMINKGEITLAQFLTMHPFSATASRIYNRALKGTDFFQELYIMNRKTYERLTIICSVIDNAVKNLVVITGYRGCGKTNFLRLIESIFLDSFSLPQIDLLKGKEIDRIAYFDKAAKKAEKDRINDEYQTLIKKYDPYCIINTLIRRMMTLSEVLATILVFSIVGNAFISILMKVEWGVLNLSRISYFF